MRKVEERRRLELTERLNDMKYDFAQQEAFFLTGELGEARIKGYEQEIAWMQRELEYAYKKRVRERISDNIDLMRSLHAAIVEINAFREEDPRQYKRERRTAFNAAQSMNFGLFAVDRTLQKIRYRPEKIGVIEDMTQRYINSREAGEDVRWQISYMRNHLQCLLKVNPDVVRMEASQWLDEKFSND